MSTERVHPEKMSKKELAKAIYSHPDWDGESLADLMRESKEYLVDLYWYCHDNDGDVLRWYELN